MKSYQEHADNLLVMYINECFIYWRNLFFITSRDSSEDNKIYGMDAAEEKIFAGRKARPIIFLFIVFIVHHQLMANVYWQSLWYDKLNSTPLFLCGDFDFNYINWNYQAAPGLHNFYLCPGHRPGTSHNLRRVFFFFFFFFVLCFLR